MYLSRQRFIKVCLNEYEWFDKRASRRLKGGGKYSIKGDPYNYLGGFNGILQMLL